MESEVSLVETPHIGAAGRFTDRQTAVKCSKSSRRPETESFFLRAMAVATSLFPDCGVSQPFFPGAFGAGMVFCIGDQTFFPRAFAATPANGTPFAAPLDVTCAAARAARRPPPPRCRCR
eukprot:gene25028-biopygen8981